MEPSVFQHQTHYIERLLITQLVKTSGAVLSKARWYNMILYCNVAYNLNQVETLKTINYATMLAIDKGWVENEVIYGQI